MWSLFTANELNVLNIGQDYADIKKSLISTPKISIYDCIESLYEIKKDVIKFIVLITKIMSKILSLEAFSNG